MDLDLGPARRVLRIPESTPAPVLEETPSAELRAPEGLRASSGELRAVPLKWDPLLTGDVGGYVVERALERDGPFDRLAAVEGRLATVYLDRGGEVEAGDEAEAASIGDGVTYFYRVRAYAPSGQVGVAASQVAAATTAPLPDPPEDLRSYSHQPRQVPLSWRTSRDPTVAGYVVYRSPTSRGPFEPLAELQGRYQTTYVDRELGDLRVFYYRVSAKNTAGGQGEPTEPVRAVTKPEPLPPVGLRVVERGLGSNQLAWEPNVEKDVVEYRLLRMREGSEVPEIVAALPRDQTSAKDTAVAADEKVSYALVAIDRDGLESAPSEPIVIQSVGYDLSATVRLDGVHLAWNPRTEEGFSGARVVRRGRLTQRDLGLVEGAEYADTDVKPGGRYRYVVVLERPDSSPAPPSSPVEIRFPER
jgi:fibronectin type 3 domain-containing protein